MSPTGRIWAICSAAVVGVLSLAGAIYTGGKASIGWWLLVLAMSTVVLGQVLELRKQRK